MSESNGSTAATNGKEASNDAATTAQTVYEFTVKDLDGNDVSLEKYRGNVLIIVNVASNCGFTKRDYKALNELYTKYKDNGLRILGFPSNQFRQEPGCATDIKEFIKKNNVEWDVFDKILVNGKGAHPLYQWLRAKQPGWPISAIKWNFTKFLVNKEGVPVSRYAPSTSAASMEKELIPLLNLPESKAAEGATNEPAAEVKSEN